MKTRLTPEELQRHHDGLCGVSIGDGDCSCLVHWVEGLQKDLDAKELENSELQKAFKKIVDMDAHQNRPASFIKTFEMILEIAKGALANEQPKKRICLCGGSGTVGATCPACGGIRP